MSVAGCEQRGMTEESIGWLNSLMVTFLSCILSKNNLTRCNHANERCRQEVPKLTALESGTRIACHAVEEQRI
jgi:hypothetical protein